MVVFICNQSGDMFSDAIDGCLVIQGRFRERSLEVVEEFLLYLFMHLQDFPLIIAKDRDEVGHSSLYGGAMEEGGILLTFFKPSDSGLLFPKRFFLKFHFLYL